MSEYQRGYNAGLMAILKLITSNSQRMPYQGEPQRSVRALLADDEPPTTTYEAGRRAAINDFLWTCPAFTDGWFLWLMVS